MLFTNEHTISLLKHDVQLDLIRDVDKAFPPLNSEMQNPVEMPDALLSKFRPLLLIRHPVLQVDSIYRSMTANSRCRPGDEDFDLITCTGHSRWLFEYFKHTRGEVPLVVDGEDMLFRTEGLGRNICAALGIDSSGLKGEWQPIPEEQRPQNFFIAAMTTTMHESTGIERPKIKVSSNSSVYMCVR